MLNQVKEQGPKGGEQNPYLTELLRLEEVAKQQGVGRWSKVSNFSFLWSTSFVLHEMNVFLDFAVVHILYTLQEPGAAEESIRDLPPSAIGEASGFDAKGFAVANKGKSLEAIVEQVAMAAPFVCTCSLVSSLCRYMLLEYRYTSHNLVLFLSCL